MRMPSLKRWDVISVAIAAIAGAAALIAVVASGASKSTVPDAPPTVLRLDFPRSAPVIPPGFLGLGIEYRSLANYAGGDPNEVDPVLETLIRNLTPGQSPVLRIGGDTTDWSWWLGPRYVQTPVGPLFADAAVARGHSGVDTVARRSPDTGHQLRGRQRCARPNRSERVDAGSRTQVRGGARAWQRARALPQLRLVSRSEWPGGHGASSGLRLRHVRAGVHERCLCAARRAGRWPHHWRAVVGAGLGSLPGSGAVGEARHPAPVSATRVLGPAFVPLSHDRSPRRLARP